MPGVSCPYLESVPGSVDYCRMCDFISLRPHSVEIVDSGRRDPIDSDHGLADQELVLFRLFRNEQLDGHESRQKPSQADLQ